MSETHSRTFDTKGKESPLIELHDRLLMTDGVLKAVVQLTSDALGNSDVCEAVYCLLAMLKRLSAESKTLSNQLIDNLAKEKSGELSPSSMSNLGA